MTNYMFFHTEVAEVSRLKYPAILRSLDIELSGAQVLVAYIDAMLTRADQANDPR